MLFPHTPQGAIFDMDGLLIDTVPLYIGAMIEAGQAVGQPVTREYLLSLVGLLGDELRWRLAHDCGAGFPVEAFLQASAARLAFRLEQGVPLKPGAAELIASLYARGMPLAVATSMKTSEGERQLDLAGLRRFFRAVVGRDMVRRSKPHPDLYREAAARLDLPPHTCVALEDSFNGIRSAHAAGCMVIMVPDALVPTDAIRALCAGVAADLHTVAQYVV